MIEQDSAIAMPLLFEITLVSGQLCSRERPLNVRACDRNRKGCSYDASLEIGLGGPRLPGNRQRDRDGTLGLHVLATLRP
jgi:hypothetical protein